MPSDTKWITVNGSHIPVEGGETKRQAVNKLRDKNKYKTAGLHFNNTTPADRKVVKAIQKEFGNAKFVIRKDRHGDEILVPKKNVNRWKELIRSFSDKTQYKLVEDKQDYWGDINYIKIKGVNVPVPSGEDPLETAVKFQRINGEKPRIHHIIKANNNPKIVNIFNKMKPYDGGNNTFRKVNGVVESVPKDKNLRSKYVSLLKKIDREIIKTPGASRSYTWDKTAMDALYAGVRSVLIHIGNSYKKRHK